MSNSTPWTERWGQAYRLRQEGKTFKAIGEILGVSASRASQLALRGDQETKRKAYYDYRTLFFSESPDSIRTLDLSIRVLNCLRPENIQTIKELSAITDNELLRIPNLGKKSLREIKDVLAKLEK